MWKRWNQTAHIWERSVDNGTSWTPLPLNAASINEGSFANLSVTSIANNTGLAQGQYNPVTSNPANISGILCRASIYARVGDIVTVGGIVAQFTIPGAGAFAFDLTLPIASNLPTDGTYANGTFVASSVPVTATIYANGAVVKFSGYSGVVGTFFGSYQFIYRVQ